MKAAIVFVALLSTSVAFAHGDHPPKLAQCTAKECTQAQIEKAIPLAIQALIKEDEIAPSWAKMKMEKLVKKQFKKNSEWVATFVDPSPKTPAEQRLYVFITLDGYLNGSNYTGE